MKAVIITLLIFFVLLLLVIFSSCKVSGSSPYIEEDFEDEDEDGDI